MQRYLELTNFYPSLSFCVRVMNSFVVYLPHVLVYGIVWYEKA